MRPKQFEASRILEEQKSEIFSSPLHEVVARSQAEAAIESEASSWGLMTDLKTSLRDLHTGAP